MPLSTIDNTGLSQSQILSAINMPTGSVIQVVQAVTQNSTSTTSSSYGAVTNLSLSITPNFTSSKILLFANFGTIYTLSSSASGATTFYRNGSDIAPTTRGFMLNSFTQQGPSSMMYLDSPSSTSSITYQVYFKTNSSTLIIGGTDGGVATSSTITAMEIR